MIWMDGITAPSPPPASMMSDTTTHVGANDTLAPSATKATVASNSPRVG